MAGFDPGGPNFQIWDPLIARGDSNYKFNRNNYGRKTRRKGPNNARPQP